ncbi:MAG: GNAT family N-acetyltransferase [Pseudomonadota bacterium]
MLVRQASISDVKILEDLIARSARELCRKDYSHTQVEAALGGAWGVDRQLINDGTYLVCLEEKTIVGCGGWSKRATLFGSDAYAVREPELLDPTIDAAKIRAFFVDPDWIGCGVGELILEACESDARSAGFQSFELMATLTGARFYKRHGYAGDQRKRFDLGDNISIDFIPMTKIPD